MENDRIFNPLSILLALIVIIWYGLVFLPGYESSSYITLVLVLLAVEGLVALFFGLIFESVPSFKPSLKSAMPAALVFLVIFGLFSFFSAETYQSPEGPALLLFSAVFFYVPTAILLWAVIALLNYLGARGRRLSGKVFKKSTR